MQAAVDSLQHRTLTSWFQLLMTNAQANSGNRLNIREESRSHIADLPAAKGVPTAFLQAYTASINCIPAV